MTKIIMGILENYIEGILDFFSVSLINTIVDMGLRIERYMIANIDQSFFNNLFTAFSSVGISLIVVKFLKKGFDMYVLWTDGDADADPSLLITNFVKAMAMALTFTVIYNIFTDIVFELANDLSSSIGVFTKEGLLEALTQTVSVTLATLTASLVYAVMLAILYIKFIFNGLEMLFLRLGGPLACLGLMDADKGVFRTYIQKFFQVTATILTQSVLLRLSIALVLSGSVIYGIATAYFAITTPKFIREFLIVSGSGGITNNVYQDARMAQMARTLALRK